MTESLEEHMQLQRVFRTLAIELPEKRLTKKLQALDAKLTTIYHGSFCEGMDAKAQENHHREGKRLEEIRNVYKKDKQKLHGSHDDLLTTRRITKETLLEVFETLGTVHTISEVEDLIWEVNDSLDGAISWEEFKKMYFRCKYDKTWLEPSELFHFTCFLMFDRECSGKVSMDDTMRMLFLKYGKEMETEMEILFGKELKEDQCVMALTYKRYFEALENRRIELIDKSNLMAKVLRKKRVGLKSDQKEGI